MEGVADAQAMVEKYEDLCCNLDDPKAEAEMTSIVAEVRTAKDPATAAAYYEKGLVKDPWGNAYRVTVRRMALMGDGEAENTSAVWYPNAYSPKGGGR